MAIKTVTGRVETLCAKPLRGFSVKDGRPGGTSVSFADVDADCFLVACTAKGAKDTVTVTYDDHGGPPALPTITGMTSP